MFLLLTLNKKRLAGNVTSVLGKSISCMIASFDLVWEPKLKKVNKNKYADSVINQRKGSDVTCMLNINSNVAQFVFDG